MYKVLLHFTGNDCYNFGINLGKESGSDIIVKEHHSHYVYRALVGLVVILSILFAIYMGSLKIDFHIDEISTYLLANGYQNQDPYVTEQWVDQNYYLDLLRVKPGQEFAYQSVINNQIQDVHPPFYYFLIHTISSFFPGVFSKWIGLGLNIAIQGLLTLEIIKAVKSLTGKKSMGLVAGLFWALSIGALSSTVFIRMYHLLALIIIFLAKFIYGYFNQDKVFSKYLIGIFICVILGGLTHYYFYIFAALLIFFSILALFFRTRIKEGFTLGFTALGGVASAFLIFPAFYDHIFNGYRGEAALNNVTKGSGLENLRIYLETISKDIFGGSYIGLIFIVLILLSLLIRRRARNKKDELTKPAFDLLVVSSLATVGYLLIVAQISPITASRYIFIFYPLLVIIFMVFLYQAFKIIIKKEKLTQAMVLISAFLIILSAWRYSEVDYLYPESQAKFDIIEDYHTYQVLLVSQRYFTLKQPILELISYEKVYPLRLSSGQTLPQLGELEDQDYILYLDRELDIDDFKNPVNGGSGVKLLYQTEYYRIFEISHQ